MKRSLTLLAVVALFLAACATTPAVATQGTISQLGDGKMTVTTADSQTPSFAVNHSTVVFWGNGLDAERASLTTGQRVKVWSSNGTATKIVIE